MFEFTQAELLVAGFAGAAGLAGSRTKERLLRTLGLVDGSDGANGGNPHGIENGPHGGNMGPNGTESQGTEVDLRGTDADLLMTEASEELYALTRRNDQLTILTKFLGTLSRCRTERETIERGVRVVRQAAGATSAGLWLTDRPSADRPAFALDLEEEEGRRLLHAVVAEAGPSFVDSSRVTLVQNQMFVTVPVRAGQDSLGLLGLLQPEILTEDDRRLWEVIGVHLGTALERARTFDRLSVEAGEDPLTGLLTHRAVQERIAAELSRARRAGGCFSLVLMDLYNFKLFNDLYGHETGDALLRGLADALRECVREPDVLSRFGGDEFLAVLPDTGAEGAARFAERVAERVGRLSHTTGDGTNVPVDLSIGTVSYPDDARRVHELLAVADARLRASTRAGVEAESPETGLILPAQQAGGLLGVLDSLLVAVDVKDRYTRHHSGDVTGYAVGLAQAVGLSGDVQQTLRIAGLLHDVGKLGVPDHILRKPGVLDAEERAVIEQHVVCSEMIIQELPNLPAVLGAVSSHHERFDGSGYPRGLRGQRIPYLGRILAVADAYSAMTADRPYRKALSTEEAREELIRVAGSQLDPTLVRAFIRWLDETEGRETLQLDSPVDLDEELGRAAC